MSTSSAAIYFLEETDFSVLLARGSVGSQPLRIEALQEVPLADTEALNTAVRTLFPGESGLVVCAVRPKSRLFHLASADEAKRNPGLAGAQKFAATHPGFASLPPAWFTALQARDGVTPGANPWLVQVASAGNQGSTAAALETLKLKTRSLSASLNAAGAVGTASAAPVWLLDVGELASHAFLVSRSGVLACGAVSLNADRIGEAVQTELGLKFRGSALKLFFNPDYDFSEAGPKIAARLAIALKPELAALRGSNAAPEALTCVGLPAGQQWFTPQLAAALGVTAFAPDLKTAGVGFASPELEAAASPAWFSFLRFIATSRAESSSPWQGELLKIDAPVAAAPTAAPAAPVAPAAKAPAPAPAPAPAVVATKPAAPTPPAAKPAAPTPPAKPAPAAAAASSSASYPPKPASAAKPSSPPPKKNETPAPAPKSAPAPVAQPARAAAVEASESRADQTPFFKKPLVLAGAALVVLIAVGGFFYAQSQKEEAEKLAAEKARIAKSLQVESEKALLAQKQADAEAAARKKLEAETAQKLAAAEAGLARAENEARAQLAARMANARGTLVVTTEPAGATVTVPGYPPRQSPATFSDIKIGKYPVAITLAHYDDVKLDLEVKENDTTDSGTIPLVRLFGSLSLTSEPADSAYELHPANTLMVMPDARRTGKTPATLSDLNPGDYAVTFTRDGWTPHTETVTVARNATARVSWTFPNGAVRITSSPAGVTVMRGGVKVGTTPLTLNEPPGAARYVLTADGYDPVTLSGNVQGGSLLELSTQFAEADRIFTINELDQKPEPINPKQPDLPYYLTIEKGRVDFQVTINRDGSTRDIQTVSTTNRDLVKFCQAALEKWKFKPALKSGRPVQARVVVPFIITPPKS